MAKYICLRDCFVDNFYHYKDRTYDIPEGKPVSPKNFKLIGEPKPVAEDEPKPIPDAPQSATEPSKEEAKAIPQGFYSCSKCQAVHRETSKLGKRHLKYKQ